MEIEPETDAGRYLFTTTSTGFIIMDVILLVTTVCGNVLTLCAIRLSRRISCVLSNQFVFSLALSDLLVGLTIPYHFAFSIGTFLSSYKFTCILRFVLIIFASASSIYNLMAIACDRYVAIVHPLKYSRYMRRKVVYTIIVVGWFVTLGFAMIVVSWNEWRQGVECKLNLIVPSPYVSFVLTPMFVSVWLMMLVIYVKIWRVAAMHTKRLRNIAQYQNGGMLPNEWKSIQVVLLILGCFSICWMPYFVTVTCMQILGQVPEIIYETTFMLAMANSSMNPLIYAWKNASFRRAFWCMIRCRSPNTAPEIHNYITDHTPPRGEKSIVVIGEQKGKQGKQRADGNMELASKEPPNEEKDWDHENSDTTVSTSFHSLHR